MTKLSPITDNISIIPKKLSIISITYIEPIMQTLAMQWQGPGLYDVRLYCGAVQNRSLRVGISKNRTLRRQQKMFLFLIDIGKFACVIH